MASLFCYNPRAALWEILTQSQGFTAPFHNIMKLAFKWPNTRASCGWFLWCVSAQNVGQNSNWTAGDWLLALETSQATCHLSFSLHIMNLVLGTLGWTNLGLISLQSGTHFMVCKYLFLTGTEMELKPTCKAELGFRIPSLKTKVEDLRFDGCLGNDEQMSRPISKHRHQMSKPSLNNVMLKNFISCIIAQWV